MSFVKPPHGFPLCPVRKTSSSMDNKAPRSSRNKNKQKYKPTLSLLLFGILYQCSRPATSNVLCSFLNVQLKLMKTKSTASENTTRRDNSGSPSLYDTTYRHRMHRNRKYYAQEEGWNLAASSVARSKLVDDLQPIEQCSFGYKVCVPLYTYVENRESRKKWEESEEEEQKRVGAGGKKGSLEVADCWRSTVQAKWSARATFGNGPIDAPNIAARYCLGTTTGKTTPSPSRHDLPPPLPLSLSLSFSIPPSFQAIPIYVALSFFPYTGVGSTIILAQPISAFVSLPLPLLPIFRITIQTKTSPTQRLLIYVIATSCNKPSTIKKKLNTNNSGEYWGPFFPCGKKSAHRQNQLRYCAPRINHLHSGTRQWPKFPRNMSSSSILSFSIPFCFSVHILRQIFPKHLILWSSEDPRSCLRNRPLISKGKAQIFIACQSEYVAFECLVMEFAK